MRRSKVLGISLATLVTISAVLFARPVEAASVPFEDIKSAESATLSLGDVLQIDSDFCFSVDVTKKKKTASKIEAFLNGKWSPVGTYKYTKDKSYCPDSKTPFLKVYSWELDQMGTMAQDGSGLIRLRSREKSPSIYISIQTFQSADVMSRIQAERIARAADQFMCMLSDGNYNTSTHICEKP